MDDWLAGTLAFGIPLAIPLIVPGLVLRWTRRRHGRGPAGVFLALAGTATLAFVALTVADMRGSLARGAQGAAEVAPVHAALLALPVLAIFSLLWALALTLWRGLRG